MLVWQMNVIQKISAQTIIGLMDNLFLNLRKQMLPVLIEYQEANTYFACQFPRFIKKHLVRVDAVALCLDSI